MKRAAMLGCMSAKESRLLSLLVVMILVSQPTTAAEELSGDDEFSDDSGPNPCRHELVSQGWLDRTHGWMSRTVCGPSRWVDGFFARPDDVYEDAAGTQLRIVGANRWQDNDDDSSEFNIRGKVELPNLQHRLSLVFDNENDRNDELRDGLDTRPEEVGQDDGGFRSALRWAANMPDRMNVDIDVGLRSELTTFVRARYRWFTPIGKSLWAFRFTQKGYWEDPEGFGSNSLFEFDRPVTLNTSFRFSSEYELTEENNELNRDWYFNQNARLYWQLGQRTGLSYSIGLDGYTDPVAAVENWRTSIRFRQSIWRPWFFWELEPYVYWPREFGYEGISGVVIRLEVQAGLPEWEPRSRPAASSG
ncbi:hypothetical protein [Alcanivorax sp. MD8A]|uniref:hypothetical protein n=1 Tax=Alcanivorax sp. MD8A TaxID=1177157 RepID=UPI001E2A831F|nr:hypothetical protein [Alcanivorax sp. MD8A]